MLDEDGMLGKCAANRGAKMVGGSKSYGRSLKINEEQKGEANNKLGRMRRDGVNLGRKAGRA